MRALVVTGVLGTGCAIVFALAALASVLFPDGTMVNAGWSGGWAKGGMSVSVPAPMVNMGGAVDDSGAVVDAGTDVPVK